MPTRATTSTCASTSTASPAPRSVLATGRPLVVPDARTSDQIVPGRAAQHGIASSLFVPLSHGGDVRHVIILGWCEPRDITPDDVGDGRARRRLGRRRARPPRGRRAPRRGLDPGPRGRPRRPARSTPRSTCRRSCSRSCTRPRSRSAPRCRASTSATPSDGAVATAGYSVPENWHGVRIQAGEGAAGRVLETGRPFISNDYLHDVAQPDIPEASRVPERARGPDGVGRRAARGAVDRLDLAAAASTTTTCARWRRSPAWPPPPAATPRPTSTSSTSRAPTR